MKKFEISSDSTCDLFRDEYQKYNVYSIALPLLKEVKGGIEESYDDFKSKQENEEFFNELRKGTVIKTSMINEERYYEYLTELSKKGVTNVVHFVISYVLSPTKDVVDRAAARVKAENPKFNCICIQSHTAAIGQGLLVELAAKLRDEGKTLEEAVKILEKEKHHLQHFICVNDLMYLRRGGRVGSASAIVGTVINLKPILVFTKEGRLQSYIKEIGMKKAIKTAVYEFGKYTMNKLYNKVVIVHTGCEELGKFMADIFKEKFNISPEIRVMGPVIGAHVGPGSVAYGFLSNEDRPI